MTPIKLPLAASAGYSAALVVAEPVGNVILVLLSGPKETFEAILAVARHEVDMDVGDALADVIVDGDERSIGG